MNGRVRAQSRIGEGQWPLSFCADRLSLTRGRVVTEGDVILLDGDCGLCTRLAVFMTPRMSSGASLRFLAIESEEGQAIISTFPQHIQDVDTVYLVRDNKPYIRSSAALRFLFYMRWYYAMWYPVGWIIPLPIRNLVYRFVARYRHRIFRKPASCVFPMPKADQG